MMTVSHDSPDKWISLGKVAAWISGLLGTFIVILSTSFTIWLATSIVELKTILASTQSAQITRFATIENTLMLQQTRLDDVRARMYAIEQQHNRSMAPVPPQ